MNAYITRKMETYHRARQALSRVQHYYQEKPREDHYNQGWNGWHWSQQSWHWRDNASVDQSSQRQTPADPNEPEEPEEDDQWYDAEAYSHGYDQPSSYQGSSTYNHQEDEHWKLHADELLPDFLQGWYLLVDSGLEVPERNLVQTALQENFSVMRVSQELRRQWPDDELRKRDQVAKQSGFWHDGSGDYENEDDFDDDSFAIDGLSEEGQILYGEATKEIQEAQAVMHQARRTLREARSRQHQLRLSRQYYKTPYQNRPQSGGYQDAKGGSQTALKCLRCGRGHRTTECPDRHAPSQRPPTSQGNHTDEAAPFVCFTEEAAMAESALVNLSGTMTTKDAVREGYGVIDGGATKTLGSIEAIQAVLDLNEKKHGTSRLNHVDTNNKPTFGFGNSSQDTCVSTASLEVSAGERPGVLQIHALDRGEGPILISVATLRKLKAVIDFDADLMVLRALDPCELIPLKRSASGHQLLPLTEDLFKDAIACKSQVPGLDAFC